MALYTLAFYGMAATFIVFMVGAWTDASLTSEVRVVQILARLLACAVFLFLAGLCQFYAGFGLPAGKRRLYQGEPMTVLYQEVKDKKVILLVKLLNNGEHVLLELPSGGILPTYQEFPEAFILVPSEKDHTELQVREVILKKEEDENHSEQKASVVA
jgi:hypothetical protein